MILYTTLNFTGIELLGECWGTLYVAQTFHQEVGELELVGSAVELISLYACWVTEYPV